MASSSGERRIVSVLLVDLADSTTIGERLGPERSKFLFDEIVRLLASEVKRFGGIVAQFTGDGLYALFGAPSAHEDDAERAVRAALAMQAVLAGYAKEVAEAYGVEVAARVGVNTGPVVLLAGDASPEERYNALGDTVNTAARLQAHAGSSGIAVGPVTASHVEAVFELELVGPLELKGKTESVTAFRVVGERARAARRLTPWVGREHEVAVLDAVFSDLSQGRGAIVAVIGEPGIGKSRLVFEVRTRWQDRVRCFEAQGVSYAQDVPYYPVRELLRGFLGLGVGDPEARVRLELKAQLAATLGEQADSRYPFLASLLGLVLEEDARDRLRDLARDSVQRQTHEAVVELARALSQEHPLGLVLEDLHFADERTLELVEELLSLADEEAVAVLLLYRSDPDLRSWTLGEAARRHYPHRFRELELDALQPEDGARVAASATEGDLPAELAAQVAERAGGNPLFLEEAARDAVESGDGDAVPRAIHETLQARLDRLAPETREVASIASVVGRSFGLPLLERLVPSQRLRPALSELQRLDLVVEERRRPTPEYRFRHGLVQETAYSTLLQERRRDLHRIVGTALEQVQSDELSEAYGLLAHHFAEADEPERAARYLLEAGNAARAVYADEEAIAHYRRALSFLDRLGQTAAARAVLFKVALAHHLAYDFEAADAAWTEAFQRPEPPPVQLEPSEPLETTGFEPQQWVAGYGYDHVSWSFGPNCFRGLLRFAPGLDVVPDLAEWISVSTDGCAYVFRLREGLRWSDGERLTAGDFEFAYRVMREQKVPSAHLLAGVAARARDEQTLELRLDEASGYMLYLLSQLAFFPWPRHQVEALGQRWNEPAPLVGNGPFVVQEVDEERAKLGVNRFWHGSRGNVNAIGVRFLGPIAAVDEWRAGGLDYLFLARHFARHFEFEHAVDTHALPVPLLSLQYLGFPHRPPFDDQRVRKALAHGLDRTQLVAGTGNFPAQGGILPPAMPGHSHDLALAHDTALARTLLAEAGYPDGRGLPELRLVHPQLGVQDFLRAEIEARWAGQWRELGVRIRQEWVPFEQVRLALSRNASFWEWGWVSDYPDPHGVIGILLAHQLMPVQYSEDVRGLLDQAQTLRSRDDRLQLYRDADRKLVAEEVRIVPTFYDRWHVLHRPWVRGLWAHPLGMGPLEDVVVTKHNPPSGGPR
jgi:ABC-type transport system substrate-binding protein/class 3 adenylate cyclase